LELLGISLVIMSIIIVAFAAITLTFVYDKYHPGDESAWKNSSAKIPGVRTTSSAGTNHAGTTTQTPSSRNAGTTSGNTNSGTAGTNSITSTTHTCQNTCSPYGSTKCAGSSITYCADFNQDGCLEWGGSVVCSTGCLNENCNAGSVVANVGCRESNPTHNPLTNGNVSDKFGAVAVDYCYNSTTLKQYRCLADNSSSSSLVGCQFGCSNGVCLSSAPAPAPNVVISGCGAGQRAVTNCGYSVGQNALCSGDLISSATLSDFNTCPGYCGNASASCFIQTGLASSPNCKCYSGSASAGSWSVNMGWAGGSCAAGSCVSDGSVVNNNGVISCNNNSNCPIYVPGVGGYCENNNYCTSSRVSTCINPGTTSSYCNATTITHCIACSDGQTCSNGQCVNSVAGCDSYLNSLQTEMNNINYCGSDSDCSTTFPFGGNGFVVYYNKNTDLTRYNKILAAIPSECKPSPIYAINPPFGITMTCTTGKCALVANECNVDSDCPIAYCEDGTAYSQYSGCNNHKCTPINYFVDPCLGHYLY